MLRGSKERTSPSIFIERWDENNVNHGSDDDNNNNHRNNDDNDNKNHNINNDNQ